MWILKKFSLTPKDPKFPCILSSLHKALPPVPGEIAPTGHTRTMFYPSRAGQSRVCLLLASRGVLPPVGSAKPEVL